MSAKEDEKASIRDESEDSASGSDSDDNDGTDTPTTVEWLATGREKRSTAGNRMKSMLANEDPDSDLELLFAEDADDAGFTDVDDGGSDAHMDSSSDDEDEKQQGDELEGEKELEKQAKERKALSRKRKAQDAIPVKFRKKVRISQAEAPAPRPKKKSERTSWLPSAADAPTRASERKTTKLSKEQLHQQMIEREAKRLKQVAIQEKKAKRLEATRRPPMTQAQRLAEAAVVEKKNSKSLNRWEEAEKQREEERLAKLAALKNRTLKGPVITFWSGMGQWADGRLDHGAKHVTVEEKPRKKRLTKEEKARLKDAEMAKGKEGDVGGISDPSTPVSASATGAPDAPLLQVPQSGTSTPATATGTSTPLPTLTPTVPKIDSLAMMTPLAAAPIPESKENAQKEEEGPRSLAPPSIPPPPATTIPPPPPKAPEPTKSMAPPSIPPPPIMMPTSSGVLALPVLAPPPMLGSSSIYSSPNHKSNVLAAPNTTHRPSPLSLPPSAPGSLASTPRPPPLNHLQPTQPKVPPPREAIKEPIKSEPSPPIPAPTSTLTAAAATAAAEPPDSASATRSAIILQNFDENAIKDKVVQTQLLFGRKMSKMAKPPPTAVCVITNHPARYRDPKTGLPYYNNYAYREIQRLRKGDYKWSRLLGAWVGSGTFAAKGVPARFLGKTDAADETKIDGQAEAGRTGETGMETDKTLGQDDGATNSI
jgi:vacuolar protein sorting-associated protein 72